MQTEHLKNMLAG